MAGNTNIEKKYNSIVWHWPSCSLASLPASAGIAFIRVSISELRIPFVSAILPSLRMARRPRRPWEQWLMEMTSVPIRNPATIWAQEPAALWWHCDVLGVTCAMLSYAQLAPPVYSQTLSLPLKLVTPIAFFRDHSSLQSRDCRWL